MPLFNRDKGRRERLLLFNREGDKLRDNNASKINNEVISDKLGHAYDAPLPTPSYKQLEWGRPPVRHTSAIVITAEPEHPDRDTQLVVNRSQSIWSSYAEGLQREQGNPQKRAFTLIWVWLGICAAIFLLCVWLAAPGYRSSTVQESDNGYNTQATTPTPTQTTDPAAGGER